MQYAQLTITFDRVYDAGLDNYCMKTVIDGAGTTPIGPLPESDLSNCLLVRPGSTSQSEMLMRVATKTELGVYTEVLPALVDTFSAPSMAAVTVVPGDKIRIKAPIPPLWSILYGIAADTDYSITSVVSATEVKVAAGFPDFAYPITFQIVDSTGMWVKLPVGGDPLPADGIANRDYGGAPLLYYRATRHYDTFGSSLDQADAQLNSLRGLAQSVVDEFNRDNYTGTSTEVFE